MKYMTFVNGKEYVIDIDRENEILVNGEPHTIDFHNLSARGLVSLLLNNHSYEGVVEENTGDMWDVLLRGELYEIKVQDERAYRLAKMRGVLAEDSSEAVIKSPMPGIIVAVPAIVGEPIKKGDTVIILESMKMENELKSPIDGMLTKVMVEAGDSVEKGLKMAVIINEEDGDK